MREPKYRLWNKIYKVMVNPMDTLPEFGLQIPQNDSTVVMQYIGRADKNNVDIYEGDIVKAIDSYDNLMFYGMICFRDCSFIIKNSYCSYYRWMDYEVEVLGNIFEDADLLEDLEILERIEQRDKKDSGKRYTLQEIKEIFNV